MSQSVDIFLHVDSISIDGKLDQILVQLGGIVAEIDDLKAANASLTTAVADVVAELKAVADALTALKGQATINPADVAAVAQSVSGLAANLETAVAASKTETGV